MVLTGNQWSPCFPIALGSCQGCPASALLFALSLELLAHNIRTSQEVKGISVKGIIHKTLLYTDDLLIYLEQVLTSLLIILNILH